MQACVLTPHLVGAEGLLGVCVLEEACDWEDVGASVHHDEVEHSGQVQSGQRRVVLHHQVQ